MCSCEVENTSGAYVNDVIDRKITNSPLLCHLLPVTYRRLESHRLSEAFWEGLPLRVLALDPQ